MGISSLVRCQHLINYHKNVGNALVTFKWKFYLKTGYDFNVPPVAVDMTSSTSLQFVPLNHRTAVQIHTPSKVLHCLPLRLLALSRLHVWYPTNHKLGLWGEVQAVRSCFLPIHSDSWLLKTKQNTKTLLTKSLVFWLVIILFFLLYA